ncbi:MAG: ABC transporter [Actinobacteria bacterium]|nr:ABC transporter [Actinomycetota bacterium]
MIRARQARLLARPTARLASWSALPAAAVVAIAMLELDGPRVVELRLAAVALCIGAAFVLDDPAAQSLAASPTPLLFRRLLRIALLLPLVGALWAVVLWRAGETLATALTLELATMLVVTLAVAALAAPLVADCRGGLAAAPALLVLLAAALLVLPARWTLFAAGPGDPGWEASHIRWALLLATAAAAFLIASRDPAASLARSGLRRFASARRFTSRGHAH